jgi:hypothetical protein
VPSQLRHSLARLRQRQTMLPNTMLHTIIAHRGSASQRSTQPQRHSGHTALYAAHSTACTQHSGAVPEDADDRAPALELVAPVGERRLGHHDQVRPVDLPELVQVRDDGDALQGLACRMGGREQSPEKWREIKHEWRNREQCWPQNKVPTSKHKGLEHAECCERAASSLQLQRRDNSSSNRRTYRDPSRQPGCR